MKTTLIAILFAIICSIPIGAQSATVPTDTIAPKVTSFNVPPIVNSTTIPIKIFTTIDNDVVSGYLITQTPTKPLATSTAWRTAVPTSFTASGSGMLQIYAWAKDRTGNVSAPVMATVQVDTTAPVVTKFAVPAQVSSLNIPITALAATDNLGVKAYIITEVATTPASSAVGWMPSVPPSYKTTSTGAKKLYAWAMDTAGNVSVAKMASCTVTAAQGAAFNITQTISDGAQRTTLAFAGLAMMTGNLDAQSFFPPGKVADYTGFQYLRDNDPDNMGHNTSFLTRIANNVIYNLNDTQFNQLKTLAVAQLDQINLYGYKRYPLMEAFSRLIDGDIPSGSSGLNLNAVKKASRELYALDGQISFDRALLYANVLKSMTATQKAYWDTMKGKGFNSWPNVTDAQIATRMKGLPQGTAVAVMTYASDLFSWYVGSIEADVYFCPERHGTYYGSFYMKDAPAVGHEGYSINEQLTATAGMVLSDSSLGYVTASQAALMSGLVNKQRNNLYAETTNNIVGTRTKIATLLRSLLTNTGTNDSVKNQVLALSSIYGDLDGENNFYYATTFAHVHQTLTANQQTTLENLRKSILSGKYADGTIYDYSIATTPFLYSSAITDTSLLTPYIANTDYLFFEP